MSGAVEALLKELYEKPKNINPPPSAPSPTAWIFSASSLPRAPLPDQQEIPSANILVVDDEAISRRAITYALEKARLKAVNVEKPRTPTSSSPKMSLTSSFWTWTCRG